MFRIHVGRNHKVGLINTAKTVGGAKRSARANSKADYNGATYSVFDEAGTLIITYQSNRVYDESKVRGFDPEPR